ncbi:MAG: glycosyltransferase [Planctomycetota bacterium]
MHALCDGLRGRDIETAVLARRSSRGWLGVRFDVLRRLQPRRQCVVDRAVGYPVFRAFSPADVVDEALERFRPDSVVIHAHTGMEMAERVLAAGKRAVICVRDTRFDDLGGEIPRHENAVYVANSAFTASSFLKRYELHAEVSPPLVDPDRYRVEAGGDRVLFFNPHPLKGLDTALQLVARRPDIEFDFVETWPLTTEVRARLAEIVPRHANLTLHAPRKDVREFYARARCVMIPSLQDPERWEEAWGRVATEAQVSGIPALATNGGGLPESVGPGGILVDPSAPFDAWEAGLSRLCDDDAEHARLSAAALEYSRRDEIKPARIIDEFIRAIDPAR